jgi:glycogen synthase
MHAEGVTGDVQLVMMGSGEGRYVEFLTNAERHNKGRVVGYVGFSPEMEHKIIAGADILLMPSRYEPCGLPQVRLSCISPQLDIGRRYAPHALPI